MRRLIVVCCALAGTAGAVVAFSAPAEAGPKGPKGPKGQVGICHFEGHNGGHEGPGNEPRPEHDFVLLTPAMPNGCLRTGGNPITVGSVACVAGHAAIDRFGRSCTD